MKILSYLWLCIFMLMYSLSFADEKDGVPVLGEDPTDQEITLVREGAKNLCENFDDDARQECVDDYYAQHNLEEDPSCD